jgi:hypothetical protein
LGHANSIFDAVIQVFDYFVLKADDAGLVPPPIVEVVVEGCQGLDFDADIETAQLFDENPADPPARKDLGRDDDALDPIPVGPFGQRARFLVGARDIGSETHNCLGWDAELDVGRYDVELFGGAALDRGDEDPSRHSLFVGSSVEFVGNVWLR